MLKNTQFQRKAKEKETPDACGNVTDWRQIAILCLTPKEVLAVRGAGMTNSNVQVAICEKRRKMKAEGWVFVAALPKSGRMYQQAIPPAGREADITRAEQSWEAEVNRQMRSSWGARIRPGKAPGN